VLFNCSTTITSHHNIDDDDDKCLFFYVKEIFFLTMKKITKMTFTLKIKFDPPIPRIIDKPLTELDEDIDEAITNWFEDILKYTVIEEEFLEIDDITHIFIDNDIAEIEIFLKEAPQTEEEMDQIRQLEQLSQDPTFVRNMLIGALLQELYIKWSSKQTRKKLFSISSSSSLFTLPQTIDLTQVFNIFISVFVTEFTEKEFLNYIVFLNWFIKDDDALYNVMIMLVKRYYPFLRYQKIITDMERFLLKQRPVVVQQLKATSEHDYSIILYRSPFQNIYLNQDQERDIKYFVIFYLLEYIFRQKLNDGKWEDFYSGQKDKLIIQSINPVVILFQNTSFYQEHKLLITTYLEKHASHLINVSDLISTSIRIRIPDHVTDLEMKFIHNIMEQKHSEMYKEFAYMYIRVTNERELLFMCLPLKDSSMKSLINRLMVINQKEDLEKYIHHTIKCVQEAIQAHHDRLKKAKKYARKKEAEARKKIQKREEKARIAVAQALARKEKQEQQARIAAAQAAKDKAKTLALRPRSYSDPSGFRPTMASWHGYGRLHKSDIDINLEEVFAQALQIQSMEAMQHYLEETVLVSAPYASAWLAFLNSHYNQEITDLTYQAKFAHMLVWTLGSFGLDGAILTQITDKSLALVDAIYTFYDAPENPASSLFISGLPTTGYTDKDFYREFRQRVPGSLRMCGLVRVTETINIGGGYLCFHNIEFVIRFLSTYHNPQDRHRFMLMLPGFTSYQYQATFGMGVNAYHIRTPDRFKEWTRSRSKWFGLVLEDPSPPSDHSYYTMVEEGNRIYFQILAILSGSYGSDISDVTDLPIPKSNIDRELLASWITGMILEGEWDEEDYSNIKSSSSPSIEWCIRIIRAAFELFEEHPDLWKQKFQQQQQYQQQLKKSWRMVSQILDRKESSL